MSTFRRATVPGATYFFTVNTYRRQKILTEASVYLALKQSIRAAMIERPFTIDAFVLLPDHLHCIWTLPPGDADYASRWNVIKRGTSRKVRDLIKAPLTASRHRRGELGLWQRRFWEHQIRDERDFEKHANYIHWNPVKHGYVRKACDWPYSSFYRFVEQGIYPVDWASDPTTIIQMDDSKYGEME